MDEAKLAKLFETVDKALQTVDVNSITENSGGSSKLPDGYFFCKLESAPEFAESKSSGKPMVKVVFRAISNGVNLDNTEVLPGTKDQLEFKYYVLDTEKNINRFIADMMKFRVGKNGEALPAQAFASSKLMLKAFQLLAGKQIFVMVSTSHKNENDEGNRYVSPITFKRAEELGLSTK